MLNGMIRQQYLNKIYVRNNMIFYVLIKIKDIIFYTTDYNYQKRINREEHRQTVQTVDGIHTCFLEAKQQVMRSLMKDTKNSFQLSKYINFIE